MKKDCRSKSQQSFFALRSISLYPLQLPATGTAVTLWVLHRLGFPAPGDDPPTALAPQQVFHFLPPQGHPRFLHQRRPPDIHAQSLPHLLGIGFPPFSVVLAAVTGVEQLVEKGISQQFRLAQQPGRHLDGEGSLFADTAPKPPLGPGVDLYLGRYFPGNGDAHPPQLLRQGGKLGIQFLLCHSGGGQPYSHFHSSSMASSLEAPAKQGKFLGTLTLFNSPSQR